MKTLYSAILSFVCLFLITAAPVYGQSVNLPVYKTGFNRPIDITNAGDGRLFVVEQDGLIRIISESGTINPVPFLDLTSKADYASNEQGLLGLVFHPNYPATPYFYVNYTDFSDDTKISRFTVSANPDLADPTSEVILFNIPQPYTNHNGGDLNFGPDGYLYIGLGDGGDAGDPGNRSQNPTNLLGKMLRVDVDGGSPYAIPPTNPFLGNPDTLEVIWALGLRNPWRFSFDRLTGDLWIGDVGQFDIEEVDFQAASSPGGENYGWRCYEGNSSYNLSGCAPIGNYDFPIHTYDHGSIFGGDCSITGGFVYRGATWADLYGKYIYNDYCTGSFWTLESDGSGGFTNTPAANLTNYEFVAYGEDQTGELYACGLTTGNIYQVQGNVANCVIPSGLTAVTGSTNVMLSWNEVPGALKYAIKGRQLGGSGFATKVTLTNGQNVGGLSSGTTYEWKVAAACATDTSNFSALESFTTSTLKVGLMDELKLDLFPNPANDVLTISGIGIEEEIQYEVHDMLGRTIESGNISFTGQFNLDTRSYTEGVYFISLRTEEKMSVERFLIQR